MMTAIAMIEFSEKVGLWSKFVFWFAAINVVLTLGFTVVVIIGGFFDLKYLFAALKEDRPADAQDDGRATRPPEPPPETPQRGFEVMERDRPS